MIVPVMIREMTRAMVIMARIAVKSRKSKAAGPSAITRTVQFGMTMTLMVKVSLGGERGGEGGGVKADGGSGNNHRNEGNEDNDCGRGEGERAKEITNPSYYKRGEKTHLPLPLKKHLPLPKKKTRQITYKNSACFLMAMIITTTEYLPQ